jgi:hypothetical protein
MLAVIASHTSRRQLDECGCKHMAKQSLNTGRKSNTAKLKITPFTETDCFVHNKLL